MTFDKDTLSPTYKMIIGEAGESCAFYIAEKLGMPRQMLETAIEAAYGADSVKEYKFADDVDRRNVNSNLNSSKIKKIHQHNKNTNLSDKYSIGDSVMIYPDKKIGIVCEPVNEKGVLRVQMPNKKIYINHKRVKLHIKACELYPEDYDFSIIFDSVENRKKRHDMERKLTDEIINYDE